VALRGLAGPVLVLVALGFEARPLARHVRRLGHRLAVTGAGPARADRGARAVLAAWRPALVLGAGLCGALRAAPPGTVVVPDLLCDAAGGPARRPLPLPVPGARGGVLVSVPQVVTSREARARAADRWGADWVDQESYAWAAAAEAHGVPFAVVRVVVDGPDDPLPLLAAPATWPAAFRLPAHALAARRRLGEVVAHLLGAA
jgi:adenosylhomocysteine nucleosidase